MGSGEGAARGNGLHRTQRNLRPVTRCHRPRSTVVSGGLHDAGRAAGGAPRLASERPFPADTLVAGMTQIADRTVLFADLRGSTALYEQLGNAEATSVVTHCVNALAHAVADGGGHVVKT